MSDIKEYMHKHYIIKRFEYTPGEIKYQVYLDNVLILIPEHIPRIEENIYWWVMENASGDMQ